MKNKWYRHFNIISAILIGIGGIGMNVSHTLPTVFYIVSLAIGVIIFAIFLVKKTQEQPESNSN